MKKNLNKNIYLTFLFIFAFVFNFYVACQGVLPIDTFLHYDSAARILEGSVPIRDYWVVHGISLDYIQALFFLIFGKNWVSYIFHSSIFNALISISTFIYFFKNGLNKEFCLLLTLSFSILAYPVSGTPFIDQHAVFLCLLGFYFFYFGLKINLKYLFFIPIFFGLAFFSKPVPSVYLISILSISFIFFIFISKRFDLIKYPLLGLVFFILVLFSMILIQKINLDMFLTQLIYYPISIGGDRFSSLNINYEKIISNYKFILLPLVISFFLLVSSYKDFKKEIKIFNFLVFILFNLACIYHQLLTKNQNFIFFLIPINLAFLVLFLEDKFKDQSKTRFKTLVFFIFIFCIFVTLKYHLRFNVERKFHDLQNTNLENAINAQEINPSLSFLQWKTPNFKDPRKEILIINETIKDLEKNKKNIMLMTNYNFISSITSKKIYTISRTYDSISFPDKENIYYKKFEAFLKNQIKLNKIEQIFILIPSRGNSKYSLDRYILEYFEPECFEILNTNNYLTKINLLNCEIK